MKISKLNIDKIIIHQIDQRDEEGIKIEPTRGSSFIKFDDDALQGFKSRVIDALGDGSKAVKMQIKEQGKDYVPYISTTLVDKEGEDYIDATYTIANRLADAQTAASNSRRNCCNFKCYSKQRKFIGIIKADIHSAYEKVIDKNTGQYC
ncbi:hypothetical protein [Enterobacter cloacae complex sp. 284J4]|uniref:hypothetical protein n=1 Tax=Enterobacter cloacae complex sp. 284J4 TaxID=3395851 RepID=UPI003CF4C9D2